MIIFEHCFCLVFILVSDVWQNWLQLLLPLLYLRIRGVRLEWKPFTTILFKNRDNIQTNLTKMTPTSHVIPSYAWAVPKWTTLIAVISRRIWSRWTDWLITISGAWSDQTQGKSSGSEKNQNIFQFFSPGVRCRDSSVLFTRTKYYSDLSSSQYNHKKDNRLEYQFCPDSSY